jgi:hypothetical protein
MWDNNDAETWIALAVIGGLLTVVWAVIRAAS